MIENQKEAIFNDNIDNIENNLTIDNNLKINEIKNKSSDFNINGIKGKYLLFSITLLGRIIMTIYSFYAMLFIINFIMQYIIIIPGIIFQRESSPSQSLLIIVNFFFSIYTSNILVIPVYEFLTFPFIFYNNPFVHIQSFFIIINIIRERNKLCKNDNNNYDETNSYLSVNIYLIIIECIYSIVFVFAFTFSFFEKIKDLIEIIILLILYFHYFLLLFSYAFSLIYLIFNLFKFSFHKYNVTNYYFVIFFQTIKNIFDFNSFFENKEKLPEINLLSYTINPLLKKCIEEKNFDKDNDEKIIIISLKEKAWKFIKSVFYYINIILFISFLVLSLVLMNIIFSKNDFISILFFVCFFFFVLILTFMINIPIIFGNKSVFDYISLQKIKFKNEYKMKHLKMISLIRLFSNSIITIIILVYIIGYSLFKKSEKDRIIDIPDEFDIKKNITKDLVLPSICSSTIYGIPLYLYIPFINDAYYYNYYPDLLLNRYSSFHIEAYKNIFFDQNYDIKIVGNLIESKNMIDEESIKMIQYNVKYINKDITIISIKGTTFEKDIYLNLQLYFPSFIYKTLDLLASFKKSESLSFKFIENSLNIPYRIFFQYTVLKEYLNSLENAYNKNKYSFYSNLVFVGHSLGGSFSKILGNWMLKPAVSLSGPGINSFLSTMGYKENYFDEIIIDLIPDADLFARFDISEDIKYRINCHYGNFKCHSKIFSLCEALIMCRNPYYELYCKHMTDFEDDEIEQILKMSEMIKK